ncbi:MAG TPA: hypothetical protein VHV31_07205 [Nitrolancea sp.]|nr:hypothetical protein [Nitrolancea sp.]
MSVNAPSWLNSAKTTTGKLDDLERESRRSLMLAGTALGTILAGLAVLNTQPTSALAPASSIAQFGRATQLFHGPLPFLATLPTFAFAVVAWGSVALLWLIYLRLIWRLRATVLDIRWVVGGAIVLSLLAMVVPPLFSTDIFSYALFGRLAGVYDLNPYVATAHGAAPSDPLLPYVYWRDIASPYGPIWSLISWAVAHGAATPPLVIVMRFKLVACGAAMLDGMLIHRLVRARWPDQASWAYLAFAWNPLVLVDGIAVGHNDVVILAVVLLGATLIVQSRPVWMMVGLIASTLIKYSTVPVVGVSFVRLMIRTPASQRIKFFGRVAALALPLVFGTFLPFWAGRRGFMSTLDEPGRGVTNPLLRIAGWGLSSLSRGHLSFTNPTIAVTVALVTFGVWQTCDLWRDRTRIACDSPHDDLAAWSRTLVMFLIVWPRIHTWYALVPLGLALAAGPNQRRLYGQVLVLTFLSYLAYI